MAIAAVLLSVWAMAAAWAAASQDIMSGFVEPVTLTGDRWVALEPLSREHIPEITAAAADGELGRLWFTAAPAPKTSSSGSTRGCRHRRPTQG